jgi:hypothetical protein
MKKKVTLPYVTMIVTVFTFVNVTGLYGQGNGNITAGFGFLDFINAGIRYNKGQMQVGVAAGIMPVKNESITSASFNIWYHFIGTSALSERKPWYGRVGLAYLHDKKKDHFNDKLLFLDVRGGREFNISENFGISIDAGMIYKIYQDVGDNEVAEFLFDFMWAMPAGGISIFYKF